jgi:prepilin-type N-terminal cleavage/methylation domain-containing protein
MDQNAFADSKKGFSIIELLVAIALLTIIAIALINTVVLYMQRRLVQTIDNHMVDAASNLVAYPDKVQYCTSHSDPCSEFSRSDCPSSISCNPNYCNASDVCIACYSNPQNGKKLFYSFNSSLLINSTNYLVYKVVICRKYANYTQNKTFVIHIHK